MSSTLVSVDSITPSRFAHLIPADERNIVKIQRDLERPGGTIVTPLYVISTAEGYELVAGHDRLEAAKRAGLTEVPVKLFDEAISGPDELLSLFLRDNHLRKSPPKRRGIEYVLRQDAFKGWSSRRIAEFVGCDHRYVDRIRRELEVSGELGTVPSRRGLDGKTRVARRVGGADKAGGEEPDNEQAPRNQGVLPQPRESTDLPTSDEATQQGGREKPQLTLPERWTALDQARWVVLALRRYGVGAEEVATALEEIFDVALTPITDKS